MALLAVLAGCSQKEDVAEVQAEGSLNISLEISESVKSAMSSDELLSTALIKIYKADFSGMVRSYVFSEAPSEIFLPVDEYRVDVEAGEMVKENPDSASWDQKSYKGQKTFTIVASQSQAVQVQAGINNVLTNVTFDPTIAENIASGFSFTIGTDAKDASKQLVYDASKDSKDGYFIVGGFEPSLYWTFNGTRIKDGSAVTKSGSIDNVQKGKRYHMTPKYTVHEGDITLDLLVDYDTEIIDDMVIFEPVSTGLSDTPKDEIWAGHVTLHADVDESEYSDPSKIKFSYTLHNTAAWQTVDAVRASEGVYSAVVKGLNGSTVYDYKLVINGEDIGDPKSITTDAATPLPNYCFEVVSHTESSDWDSFFDPNSSDPTCRKKFWDSGSSASAGMLGSSYAICYSDTDVPSGAGSSKSARLESKTAAGKMAAGNLFVGEFAGLDGLNGKVNFGRSWSSRPTGVRLWYKYKGGKVDKSCKYISTDEYDIASIQVAVGTWSYKKYGGTKDCPVQVNTGDQSTFWSYPDLPETIAYGKFEERGNGNTGNWKQITIKLDYKSEKDFPTYIIVSTAASKYGDYFAGSSSSRLWLDKFELLYE